MGYDIKIFVDSVDEELMCGICMDVLEDAIQVMPCEHLYCKNCLNKWFMGAPQKTCPNDRSEVDPNKLTAVPRAIQNMLSRLMTKCIRCEEKMPLSKYRDHNCFQYIEHRMSNYIEEIDESWKRLHKLKGK